MKDINPSAAARRLNDLTPPPNATNENMPDMAPGGKRRKMIDADDVDTVTGQTPDGHREPVHPDDIDAFDDLTMSGREKKDT